MTDIIRQRIRQAIEEKGSSAARVSVAAGLGRTFLRDFFSGRAQSMSAANMQRIAAELGVTVAWLTGESDSRETAAAELHDDSPRYQAAGTVRDVPVYGTAAGSVAGSIAISDNVIDWLPRLPGLRGARDAYALYVTGASMEPRYHVGDVVFVHPHRPLRAGDVCVIQTHDHDNGDIRGWLKEFVRRSDRGIVARQYNPPAEITFNPATVRALHRVLTQNELIGI